jgi:DNA invertase Pin-like site-specific DNA recombinase
MVAMIATAAKMERERLSARTKAGMQRVMTHGTASGQPVGRPRAGLESRCHELRAAGLSFKRIGMSLGVSPAYVHKSLRANG